jgi:hypothetical protein
MSQTEVLDAVPFSEVNYGFSLSAGAGRGLDDAAAEHIVFDTIAGGQQEHLPPALR